MQDEYHRTLPIQDPKNPKLPANGTVLRKDKVHRGIQHEKKNEMKKGGRETVSNYSTTLNSLVRFGVMLPK